MSRSPMSPLWAISLLLLPGCSHPAAVPLPPKVAVAPAAPPPPVMPAPIVWQAYRPLVDEDCGVCDSLSDTCHPQGDLVNGQVWPYHAHPFEALSSNPSSSAVQRYQSITEQREQVHGQEADLYATYSQTQEGDPAHDAALAALQKRWGMDAALSRQQAAESGSGGGGTGYGAGN